MRQVTCELLYPYTTYTSHPLDPPLTGSRVRLMFWRLSGTEFQDVRGPIDTSSPRPAELRSDGDQFSYRREYSLDQKTQTVSYVQNEIERIASVVIAIDRIAIFFSQRPRRSIYCIRSGACRFDKKLSDRRGTARCQLPRNSTETTCTTKSFCRQSFTICAKTTVVERRSSEVLST